MRGRHSDQHENQERETIPVCVLLVEPKPGRREFAYLIMQALHEEHRHLLLLETRHLCRNQCNLTAELLSVSCELSAVMTIQESEHAIPCTVTGVQLMLKNLSLVRECMQLLSDKDSFEGIEVVLHEGSPFSCQAERTS